MCDVSGSDVDDCSKNGKKAAEAMSLSKEGKSLRYQVCCCLGVHVCVLACQSMTREIKRSTSVIHVCVCIRMSTSNSHAASMSHGSNGRNKVMDEL